MATLFETLAASLAEQLGPDWTPESAGYPILPDGITWQAWIATKFPHVMKVPLGRRHKRLWEWFDALEIGVRPKPRVEPWCRGGAKSSTAEVGLAYVASKLSRRFALIVSDTQEQADSHVASEAVWLQDAGASPKLSKVGTARPLAWRRNQLRTANGFSVAAFGLDGGQRGIKIEQYRPDLIIFDDFDARHDSPLMVLKKIQCITESIMPAGSSDCAFLFLQNLVHANSIMSQLASGRADFLLDRDVAEIEPAVVGLKVEMEEQGEGRKALYRIVGGVPTWEGQDLATCEKQINDWGYESFLREAQHEVRAGSSFFDQFDEARHVPFVTPYTPDRKPPTWWTYFGGIDWGYAAPFAFTLMARDDHGCIHCIENTEGTRLTNEMQAARIVAILSKWGVDPRTCVIGFDESMANKETVNGVVVEAAIEAFWRAGLNCWPVKNHPAAQAAGWDKIRDLLRAPGTPSGSFQVWKGYTSDLVHALANATHDRMQPEKLLHDECSHSSQSLRYSISVRPETAQKPKQPEIPENAPPWLLAAQKHKGAAGGKIALNAGPMRRL